MMRGIINERKYAFLKGINILNGVMVANKVVHEEKTKKKGCLIFKANFEMAYDSIR